MLSTVLIKTFLETQKHLPTNLALLTLQYHCAHLWQIKKPIPLLFRGQMPTAHYLDFDSFMFDYEAGKLKQIEDWAWIKSYPCQFGTNAEVFCALHCWGVVLVKVNETDEVAVASFLETCGLWPVEFYNQMVNSGAATLSL